MQSAITPTNAQVALQCAIANSVPVPGAIRSPGYILDDAEIFLEWLNQQDEEARTKAPNPMQSIGKF